MASYDLTRTPALRDLQELGRRQKNVTDGLGQRVSALETNAPTKVGDLTNDKKSPPPSTKLSLRQTT